MNAADVFTKFVGLALVPEKAARFAALATTEKGQHKILAALDHKFQSGIQSAFVRRKDYEALWELPCYAFHESVGFGTKFPTVRDAYERLSAIDGWLIILCDGSVGIYRPEGCWDSEVQMGG